VEADPVAPKVDPPPAEEAAEGELAKPRGKPVKPAKVPRATRPDVKPVDKADPPAEEAVQEPPGFLTLDTIPWTTVFLGKKKLGETPLVRVPVPSGSLELTLVNTQAGVRETYVARVKPGDVYKARLDLQ
jgi:serine/threonine-protein kinase